MKKTWLIIGAIALVILIYGWSSYNTFVNLNGGVDNQWAQVETVYQRRFDLIPNLVNAVKGAMKQEQTIFTELADARARYAGAKSVDDKATAATQVESSLGRLLAVVENYPQLQSSQAVRDLMVQLEGSENRISTERQRYNDEVKTLNVSVARFPGNIMASIFGFKTRPYFQASAGAENAPSVNL